MRKKLGITVEKSYKITLKLKLNRKHKEDHKGDKKSREHYNSKLVCTTLRSTHHCETNTATNRVTD